MSSSPIRGTRADGHDYLPDVLSRGALAVVVEHWPKELDDRFTTRANVIVVRHTRRALAKLAANFHGHPSKDLILAGVTGTNGKTTVTYLLQAILEAAGKNVGRIGTTGATYRGERLDTVHTTPDALELQSMLTAMRDASVSHVVMEVSSHALSQARVSNVHFKVAGFTNLSRDHLDYHGTMDEYFAAKALLFTEVLAHSEARGRMAVINIDDEHGKRLAELWDGKTFRVSARGDASADLFVVEAEHGMDGTRAVVRDRKGEWSFSTPLIGPHNLENVLVAVGMAQAMGFSNPRIEAGIAAVTHVPGRLLRVQTDDERVVFVDYAHTPDALDAVLSGLAPLTKGRLIVVFGCGGDRDRGKRPEMGRVVARSATLAVLTSDNPRSEDPGAIADEVKAGFLEVNYPRAELDGSTSGWVVELDRRTAIRLAVSWLEPNDVLVIAGKGHETRQIIGNEALPFDDVEETRRILAGLPPPPPMTSGHALPVVAASEIFDSVDVNPDIVKEDAADPPEGTTE
ncbi:MAG: UDP-N-acetylmuramoyl-L-alanyl-D-glutamate--2,6-diaminopimelate ligase [Myxococcales bacterium]|nr:UDP-N-acetylmuramoyl-L-alanyl-D-glutamate--2,6-diaminopimelate ligase [Myxococcales bacterium]